MNKSTQLPVLLTATGVSGVALYALVNLAALAGFQVAEVFGFVASAALIAFFVSDYARRPQSLRLPAAKSRNATAITAVAAGPRARATAYGLPRNRRDRLAA
ncbi:hypothetical protein [Oleiharenicola lentus]|uniref:hypothetical protein n=1 Tax=Oleiharenicola lentus TaxID=2508720 RepID=UPI003F66A763